MKILAIDPGERVGWARGVLSEVVYEEETFPEGFVERRSHELTVEGHGITALKPFAIKLVESIADYDVVVYETFKLTRKGAAVLVGSDLQTAQLVGMIRLARWLAGHDAPKIVTQPPAIKATANLTLPAHLRAKLDAMPKSHDDAHDGDAILHAWHYFWERYV